jgi:hypothetical protein
MHSGAIMRVFGVDGPCQGVIYLDFDSGHVVFNDTAEADRCVYRLSEETVDTIAGRYRAAYFDHFDSPRRGTHRLSPHRTATPSGVDTGPAAASPNPPTCCTRSTSSPPGPGLDLDDGDENQ